ncbi:MAG TPA: hypothetical protein VH186_04935 [Chloroflexia bacterium]|nr:hypothetical protein [Chloroflexia bacterium]
MKAHSPTLKSAGHTGLDRFLVIILAGIGLLLVLAFTSLLVLKQPARTLTDTTPDGTVLSFMNALSQRNYQQAYSYLSDSMVNKPSEDEFTRFNDSMGGYHGANERIEIYRVNVTNPKAVVTLRYYQTGSGPLFGNQYSYDENVELKQEGEVWRITWLSSRYIPTYYPYKY